MTNLTELITLWIGEGNQLVCPIAERIGYNQALKDLKSKIPDLIEQIEKEQRDEIVLLIDEIHPNHMDEAGGVCYWCAFKDVILKTLNNATT